MRKVNYHTHTPRCHHAKNTEEEYVQTAIHLGFEELGFADHTPWHYESGYIPVSKMHEDLLEDYVTCVKAAGNKYKDQIKVYCGLEAEYFEERFDWLLSRCKDLDIDYLILGHHYHYSDEFYPYNGFPTDSKESLVTYVDDLVKGMHTGKFSYVAHPDLINYVGDDEEFYLNQMRRICITAKELDIPLEFNMLGFREGRNYPDKRFFELMKETGNKTIIGFDAHSIEELDKEELYQKAVSYLNSLGLEIVTELKTGLLK